MPGDADLQDEPLAEPGSPEDLRQRLRLVPLGDTARGLLFTSLLETVRQEVDDEAFQRCLAVAGDTHFLAFFNYPVRALLSLFYAAAWEMSGRYGGFEGAMKRLGSRLVPDFLQSAVGRMMGNVAGMDARHLLGWVPVVYPTIYNHGSLSLTWQDDQSGRGEMSGALFLPSFVESAFTQLLAPFALSEFSMRAWSVGPARIALVFSWKWSSPVKAQSRS